MNRSSSHYGNPEQPHTDRSRDAKKAGKPYPFYEPSLTPGSCQNDPDHHVSHGGYWEREVAHSGTECGFSQKAADEGHSRLPEGEGDRRRENDQRGKGPRHYRWSDERISEYVNHRLTDDHYLNASDIAVSVSEQEVTLSGTVGSGIAKRHAEDCADTVSGVEHVQNNLRVSKSTEQTSPDGS